MHCYELRLSFLLLSEENTDNHAAKAISEKPYMRDYDTVNKVSPPMGWNDSWPVMAAVQ